MEADAGPVTVVLADDHELFREGLAFAIAQDDRLVLVGKAANGSEALDMIDGLEPDVALLDVQMPTIDGLSVCERLRSRGATTQVVMLTAFDEPALVERARSAGAADYINKKGSRREICETLVRVGGESRLRRAAQRS